MQLANFTPENGQAAFNATVRGHVANHLSYSYTLALVSAFTASKRSIRKNGWSGSHQSGVKSWTDSNAGQLLTLGKRTRRDKWISIEKEWCDSIAAAKAVRFPKFHLMSLHIHSSDLNCQGSTHLRVLVDMCGGGNVHTGERKVTSCIYLWSLFKIYGTVCRRPCNIFPLLTLSPLLFHLFNSSGGVFELEFLCQMINFPTLSLTRPISDDSTKENIHSCSVKSMCLPNELQKLEAEDFCFDGDIGFLWFNCQQRALMIYP